MEKPPVSEELIYVNHEHGFALCSIRSGRGTAITCNARSRSMPRTGPIINSGRNSRAASIRKP